MINCKIPKTAVIGMTAVLLLCGCAGQKALDAEPPASTQEVYINGGSPRYTQKKLVNGELITVLDSVPESEVDLTRWDQ